MTKIRPNRKQQQRGGRTYAALAILAVIVLAVVGFLVFAPHKKTSRQPSPPPTAGIRPAAPAAPQSQPRPVVQPASPAPSPVPAPLPTPKPDYPTEKPEPVITTPEPAVPATGKGRLAIIIDDMGSSMQEARSLSAIGVPLTFSIIPGLGRYREVAAFAGDAGIETMIHVPMQSKGWPQRKLELNGLLVAMGGTEIRGRLEGFVRDLPRAVGANNHMGSEFTEHEQQMSSVLAVLKEKELFFIDSVTSPRSVGQRLARVKGVRSARRNVFLDNEQNSAYILGQLNQAVRLARKTGVAIAVCHPHPATIKTLSGALPSLKKQGITLVSASQLVR